MGNQKLSRIWPIKRAPRARGFMGYRILTAAILFFRSLVGLGYTRMCGDKTYLEFHMLIFVGQFFFRFVFIVRALPAGLFWLRRFGLN